MGSRPGVDRKTRKDILERYGHCCVKCGRRKYISSRYNPCFDSMRQSCFAIAKYFHEISIEEFNDFKKISVDDYFKNKLEPMFIGIRKIIYGFDDEELQLDIEDRSIKNFDK